MKQILIRGLLASVVTVFGVVALAQGEPQVVPGEYLIKFKVSSGGPAVAQTKLYGKASLKASFPGLGILQVSMKSGPDEQANLEALKSDPDVEYIEPNYILEKSEIEPNGPLQSLSYEDYVNASARSTSANAYSQSSSDAGVAGAWSLMSPLSSSSDKVIVAVIDTGLDRFHDVFKSVANGGTGALWVNPVEYAGKPNVDDDQNGFVDDINGWNFISNSNNFADDDNHGTHVAGIVVGTGQNIFARPLKESKVLVMPLKFLGANGSGSTSNAIRAIYYAVNNGARVINNSWGGAGYSRALHDAITFAYDHRVLVVSAAGNYAKNNDHSPMYPANYDVPSNIAVASVGGAYDFLSSFSNYGVSTVHIGSPGEYVDSTVPGNKIMTMSGTSMAAPFVAGLAGLAFREAPSLSGYQMKQILLQTVQTSNSLYGKVSSGGRIDAETLIQVSRQMVATASAQPDYEPNYLSSRGVASSGAGDGSGGDSAGGCGLVKAITQNGPGSGSGSGATPMGIVVVLLLLPLVLWKVLRSREPQHRRRHERFKMSSEIRVTVGDRELVGSMKTISEGGLSFNVDQALEKGGTVTMRIQSPDGHESIEVQGQVVWCENNQAYGVQFSNAKQGTLAMIRDWSSSLIKT